MNGLSEQLQSELKKTQEDTNKATEILLQRFKGCPLEYVIRSIVFDCLNYSFYDTESYKNILETLCRI